MSKKQISVSIEEMTKILLKENGISEGKYILGLDSSNFDYLTSKIKKEQMDHLLELAISNNYHLIKEYENNINTLTQTELNYGY